MFLIDLDWDKYYKHLKEIIIENPLNIKYHPDISAYEFWKDHACFTYRKTKHSQAMKLFTYATLFHTKKIKIQLINFLHSKCGCDIDIIKNIISQADLTNILHYYSIKAFDWKSIHKEWDRLDLEYEYTDENGNHIKKNVKPDPINKLYDSDDSDDLDEFNTF
tara:strand:- start:705 stop:1193 length:489 start_codon:yes stop_codon:yes gene_type:complete